MNRLPLIEPKKKPNKNNSNQIDIIAKSQKKIYSPENSFKRKRILKLSPLNKIGSKFIWYSYLYK